MNFVRPIFTLLVIVAGSASCTRPPESEVKAEGHRVGHLRGYQSINNVFGSRILASEMIFEVGWFIDGSNETGETKGFRALLGSFQGGQGQATYQNGAPNAVNMLLWDLILSHASEGMSSICSPDETTPPYIRITHGSKIRYLRLKDSLASRLTAACTWSSDGTVRRDTLKKLWFGLMGFEAPSSELDVFVSYFGGDESPVALLEPKERVRVLTRAIFLNPFFILES